MQDIEIKIKSILNDIDLTDRIRIIERIGKHLRRRNSIETANEVNEFKRNNGIPKTKVDEYPT